MSLVGHLLLTLHLGHGVTHDTETLTSQEKPMFFLTLLQLCKMAVGCLIDPENYRVGRCQQRAASVALELLQRAPVNKKNKGNDSEYNYSRNQICQTQKSL